MLALAYWDVAPELNIDTEVVALGAEITTRNSEGRPKVPHAPLPKWGNERARGNCLAIPGTYELDGEFVERRAG